MEVTEFFDRAYARYPRYWTHGNRDSKNPEDFPSEWAKLLRALASRPAGRALDLGAGEGSDAIRLARLGYEVDAIEASAVGVEKIEKFARQSGVRVNVKHGNVNFVKIAQGYDCILCCGLLHYINDKETILRKIQGATRPGGFNLVSLFSDVTPIPECHRIVDVFSDKEDGIIAAAYAGWLTDIRFERNKPDRSHPGFPPHTHSMIKLLAQKPIA
jgi:2-polyprenyl-3-methyl-5-hydroxy-6-metoxy-1,4-benzoquinol methylase